MIKYFPPEEYIDTVLEYIDAQMSSNQIEMMWEMTKQIVNEQVFLKLKEKYLW